MSSTDDAERYEDLCKDDIRSDEYTCPSVRGDEYTYPAVYEVEARNGPSKSTEYRKAYHESEPEYINPHE